MKWLGTIVGVLLVLFGGLWVLQGTGVVTRGFMSGHVQYAILGIVSAAIGIGLVVFANRRRPNTPAGSRRGTSR
jgi:hypothetical protein